MRLLLFLNFTIITKMKQNDYANLKIRSYNNDTLQYLSQLHTPKSHLHGTLHRTMPLGKSSFYFSAAEIYWKLVFMSTNITSPVSNEFQFPRQGPQGQASYKIRLRINVPTLQLVLYCTYVYCGFKPNDH